MSHLWGQVKTSTGACILSVDPEKVACRLRRRWFTNWGASSLFRAGRTKSFSRWTRMSTTPCVWNIDLNVNGTNIRNNSTIWVLIRGEAYRTNRTTVQDEIAVRLNRHVIQAIRKSHSTSNIQPVFCLQRHTFNATLQYKLANVSKLPVSVILPDNRLSQPALWSYCVQRVPAHVDFAIIVRADLLFYSDINVRFLHTDRIFIQWNLFQDCYTHEIADQMQGIGGRTLHVVQKELKHNQNMLDKNYPGSLHNFYNFAERLVGARRISYFNYFSPGFCHDNSTQPHTHRREYCMFRGNPQAGLLENGPRGGWYTYDRFYVTPTLHDPPTGRHPQRNLR